MGYETLHAEMVRTRQTYTFSRGSRRRKWEKCLVYAKKPDSFVFKIPTKAGVLTNAITDYEKYLNDLKAKLFQAIFSRTLDHKQADMLTNQVFEELGLPEV
ncbi:MAG: hypothetical protein L0Y62_04675 [Nitrospirae bacterium]|nr:hypothetical protein [Nitrospirota bacterium]